MAIASLPWAGDAHARLHFCTRTISHNRNVSFTTLSDTIGIVHIKDQRTFYTPLTLCTGFHNLTSRHFFPHKTIDPIFLLCAAIYCLRLPPLVPVCYGCILCIVSILSCLCVCMHMYALRTVSPEKTALIGLVWGEEDILFWTRSPPKHERFKRRVFIRTIRFFQALDRKTT